MIMRAAYFADHGGLDRIQIGEIANPTPGPDEVLVQCHYGALNHLDLFVMKGWPGLNLNLPHIMGSDGAGIVEAVGEFITKLKPGDRVTINPGIGCGKCNYCLSGQQNYCDQFAIKGENNDGTFAEFFTVPERNVVKIPDSMPFDQAAAAPLTFLTAWRMLVTQGGIKPGDTIVIQGAGGGVATAAIQIAKLWQARVIATSGTAEKCDKARQIGADVVFNYRDNPKYGSQIFKDITNKKGIDLVVDSVGSATFTDSLRLLKTGGKFVTCGATTGGKVEMDLRSIFWKQLHVIGSTMATHSEFQAVMDHVFAGKLTPVIDKVFPLDQVKDAEDYMHQGLQFGKILIRI
jgi:NADPH:quinone reductase-like Zn-dependent oxidoreductase